MTLWVCLDITLDFGYGAAVLDSIHSKLKEASALKKKKNGRFEGPFLVPKDGPGYRPRGEYCFLPAYVDKHLKDVV